MFRTLREDLDAVMDRDPAARSRWEVFFLYSGFKAVRSHRKANWCYRRVGISPRLLRNAFPHPPVDGACSR